jgi:hypothetical protein
VAGSPPRRTHGCRIDLDLTIRDAAPSITRAADTMTTHISHLRAELGRRQIEHEHLSDVEAFHLSSALRGWHVTPRTAAGSGPIDARVWLASALAAGGVYVAPETAGHPAELRDGGPTVDSVVLMAIVRRHFLPLPDHAWDDESLGAQLGLPREDFARAQVVLDEMQRALGRPEAPLGAAWWTRSPLVRGT